MSGAIPPLPALTKVFESAEQAITYGATNTVAHGLGLIPLVVQCVFRCKTAQHGFAIGDEWPIFTGWAIAATDEGFSVLFNATNVYVVMNGTPGRFHHRTTFAGAVPTAANWKLVVRAYR